MSTVRVPFVAPKRITKPKINVVLTGSNTVPVESGRKSLLALSLEKRTRRRLESLRELKKRESPPNLTKPTAKRKLGEDLYSRWTDYE